MYVLLTNRRSTRRGYLRSGKKTFPRLRLATRPRVRFKVSLRNPVDFLIERHNHGSIVFFIHGGVLPLSLAHRRFRQIRRILAPLNIGTHVCISWPGPTDDYRMLTENAMRTGASLATCLVPFLRHVGTYKGNKVGIICHSMGAQVLERAMGKFAAAGPNIHSTIDRVILAAPDIRTTAFNPGGLGLHHLGNLAARTRVDWHRSDLVLRESSSRPSNSYPRGKRMGMVSWASPLQASMTFVSDGGESEFTRGITRNYDAILFAVIGTIFSRDSE